MENLPTIDIIFPLRNRSWVLPYFLDCIYNLDYPKEKLSIICLLNDSTDNSSKIINQFAQQHKKEYKNIHIYTYNLKTPEYQSQGHHRGGQALVFKNINGISKPTIYGWSNHGVPLYVERIIELLETNKQLHNGINELYEINTKKVRKF